MLFTGSCPAIWKLRSSVNQPVKFEASVDNKITVLKWATVTEENNAYFVVDRSFDGVNYMVFDKVNAKGNSNSAMNYSSKDLNLHDGYTYYRLKQVDQEGRIKYTGVIAVERNQPTLEMIEENLASN